MPASKFAAIFQPMSSRCAAWTAVTLNPVTHRPGPVTIRAANREAHQTKAFGVGPSQDLERRQNDFKDLNRLFGQSRTETPTVTCDLSRGCNSDDAADFGHCKLSSPSFAQCSETMPRRFRTGIPRKMRQHFHQLVGDNAPPPA